MGIPLTGATESNHSVTNGVAYSCAPSGYYEYRVTTSNRTEKSIHVKIELWLWMGNYGSFFTYAVGHDCWVRGGNSGDYTYVYTKPKWDRLFWGHQGSLGGNWYEVRNGWVIQQDTTWSSWDCRYHNGPYVVFDKDVPMGLDDSGVEIIPCITRPDIAYEPYQILNWGGLFGEWRPSLGGDKDNPDVGYYGQNQGHGPSPENAVFLNNRYKARLEGFSQPGAYKRPGKPALYELSPKKIDVAQQWSQQVKARWQSTGATFDVYISTKPNHSDKKKFASVPAASKGTVTEYSFLPPQAIGYRKENFSGPNARRISAGDKFYIGILAKDNKGVSAKEIAWFKDPIEYTEVKSYAPNKLVMYGHNGAANVLFFQGESAKIYYGGETNGSFPIATYRLVRYDSPNKGYVEAIEWLPSKAKTQTKPPVSGANKLVTEKVGPVASPNKKYEWELCAYDSNGDPVYMKNGKWLRVTVHYYGGTIYIYDSKNTWREGVAWIYDGKKWREAEAVYIYTKNGWKTL